METMPDIRCTNNNKYKSNNKPVSACYFNKICFLLLIAFFTACSSNSSPGLSSSDSASIKAPVRSGAINQRRVPVSFLERGADAPKVLSHSAHGSAKINSLAVSENGNVVFSGASDGTVVKSEVQSNGEVFTEIILESSDAILDIELSPSGRHLAVSQYSSIIVYNVILKKVISRMSRIKGRIVKIAWDPQEELLAAGLATGELYVWNVFRGRYAGRNSKKAIESYENFGVSSVVGLAFHPRGGALFVAERIGEIKLWRLLRKDEELGLRDPNSFADRENEGRKNVLIAKLPNSLEAITLSSDGSMLFAADSKGLLHGWKLKGLVAMEPFQADSKGLFNVATISIIDRRSSQEFKLLATSGREQDVSFWCEPKVGSQGVLKQVLSKTPKFENPVSVLDISTVRPRLWAVEKTGSLMGFRAEEMLKLQSLRQCL